MSPPRVTIALATRNRAAFLREAIASCLAQTFTDFELLICDNASTDETPQVVAEFSDPRIRSLRNEADLGMVGNWNRCLAEARGELIANLPDDDLMLPSRLARQVAVFDAHPETGVVYGDAEMVDAQGRPSGRWAGRDLGPDELLAVLVRMHNVIPYPSTVIHRRVFEAVGGYREGFRIAADMDLWLRAAPHFRFRHTPGGPVVRFRRHDGSGSHESQRALEVEEVERCLEDAIAREGAAALAPEAADERTALAVLADAMRGRGLALPGLAERLERRATEGRRRIMLTSFGFNDSGGGTIVPRLLSRELVRRGWDVTVFHAALGAAEPRDQPNQVRTWHEDGVRLIGVFNRPSPFMELGNPRREIDDPAISRAFAEALALHPPDVVHFHNLHNLGAGLIDEAAERGIPSLFSTHNYWLACPRLYLYDDRLDLCHGPGDGSRCASCIGAGDAPGYRDRLREVRARFSRGVGVCLAVSEAMRRTLITSGYPEEMIDVVHQAMPHDQVLWDQLGRDRVPGRQGERLVVGFFGSAYPHKGPSLLVEAAQQAAAEIDVRIYGEVPEQFAQHLRSLDGRGVVSLHGAFSHEQLPELLAEVDVAVIPSLWWDCAPLMVSECLAGRVPVLAARMGGIADFVQDGVTGLLFDGRDRTDLARCLDRLASEPGLVERLQAAIPGPGSFAGYVDTLEHYYAGQRPNRDAERHAPISVRWRGDQGLPTSLSTINTAVCAHLDGDPDIAVQRVLRSGDVLDAALPLPAEVEVRHQWPFDFSASASRLAVIQPWEFGAIPAEWVEPIRAHVDEVWVPSEFVRRMYLAGGVDPERVVVVPNGVDLELFRPDGPRMQLDAPGTRFLFVGGLIHRKGPDVLLQTYLSAFAGRDDVSLVVKDFGADSIYAGSDRDALRRHAEQQLLPRIVYLGESMSPAELASLYRACDVMVLPYRGEGFCMPALEAMAAGMPVIVSAGGPTDEFVPDAACWRIPTSLRRFAEARVDHFPTAGTPFELEPDPQALVAILQEAAADPEGRARRGRAGHAAAQAYSWQTVGAAYAERLRAIAARPPRHAAPSNVPAELEGDAAARLLATPAWLGEDRLGELLAAWVEATTPGQPACLYLLADPRLAGDEARCTQHVLEAAARAGADLDRGADITIVLQPLRGDLAERIHREADGYVRLHAACAGHERLARRTGNQIVEPTVRGLSGWLAERGQHLAA